MARFLLAWELGANLGHLTRLRPVAQALQARGHEVVYALRDVSGSRAVLGAPRATVLQAPLALNAAPRAAWTLADVLLSCGYASAPALAGLVDAWSALMGLAGCDALVADHAPTALLAARAAGIPALHIGHGFSVPPRQSPLPVFRDWVAAAPQHAAQADAQALASVNAVLAERRAAPLSQLCELFHPERTLLCTWPELDHYAGLGRSAADYHGPDCDVGPGQDVHWPAAPGPRVFAYLRASHPDTAEVLRALHALALPSVCFVPDAGKALADVAAAPTLRLSTEPLHMQQALAGCALLVCHAGQATVAQGLRLGIPSLLLPVHAEQFLLARQLQRHGAALNAATLPRPADYRAVIGALVSPDSAQAAAARSLAAAHAGFAPAALTGRIADAAVALLR